MALSMEEQRILAEIERQLAGDDPSLAARLTTFGRPGLVASLRTTRGRVLISFLTVALVALLSLMVYSLVPFRVLPVRGGNAHPTAAASGPAQAAGNGQPGRAATTGGAVQPAGAGQAGAAGEAAAAGRAADGTPASAAKAAAAGQAPAAADSGAKAGAAPAGQAASPQQAPSG